MFNLFKKSKKAVESLPKQIDDAKFVSKKDLAHNDILLNEKRKNNDTLIPFDKTLEDIRNEVEYKIVEKLLNDEKERYGSNRNDKAYRNDVKPLDLINEASHQEKADALSVKNYSTNETEYWDKIIGNHGASQLQNHPSRFDDIVKTFKQTSDASKNRDMMQKKEHIKKMVSASVKVADEMIFSIYAKNKINNIKLSSSDRQIINDINSSKARLLAFENGHIGRLSIAKSANASDKYDVIMTKIIGDSVDEKIVTKSASIEDIKKIGNMYIDEADIENSSGWTEEDINHWEQDNVPTGQSDDIYIEVSSSGAMVYSNIDGSIMPIGMFPSLDVARRHYPSAKVAKK